MVGALSLLDVLLASFIRNSRVISADESGRTRGFVTVALGLAAMFVGANAVLKTMALAGALMFFFGLAIAVVGARKLRRRCCSAAPAAHRHE
jgi:Sec-independent protein secretion pathway component TatC